MSSVYAAGTPMKPTRYEAIIELDSDPKYKATGKVVVAIGAVGMSDSVPAVVDENGKEVSPAVPSALVWSAEIGAVTARTARGPMGARDDLVAKLKHLVAELESASLPE